MGSKQLIPPFLSRRQFFAGLTALTVSGLRNSEGAIPIQIGAAGIGAILQEPSPGSKLQALANAGYREVETNLDQLLRFGPQITAAGLQMPSAFIRTPIINGNWALWRASTVVRGELPPDSYTLDVALGDAKRIPGLRNLTVVLLLPEERRNLDDYRRFADQMNRAGERCRQAGVTLSYHPHSFEYESIDGQLPIQLLLERFDPKHVMFEVDIFWMTMGGWDPIEFVRQRSSRVTGLHLKDRSRGAPSRFVGSPWELGSGARVPIGDGVTNFRTVLETASNSGVVHCFVEDESEGDRF